jgi:peptidoglycan/xylan/chitin deacetylase (PgdA/CDA1 family)
MIVRAIPILMYHQVDAEPPKGSPMRGLVVSPKTFSWHMWALNALGFRGLSMTALEPYLRGEKQGRVFGITFDDGYANNLHHALPVLQRYGFSSTCYVVADLIGQYNRWDDGRGVPRAPLMTVGELQQWVDAGQEVGSHTLSHPFLTDLDADQQWAEIAQSRERLESCINQSLGVRHFCYPYGALNPVSVACARKAGYTTATTTVRGRVTAWGNELLLPRVLVSRTTTWMQLLIKCLTRYEDRRGVKRLAAENR